MSMPGNLKCEMIAFDRIDFSDPIFDSIRSDYRTHEQWCKHAMQTSQCRCAFAIRGGDKKYAGIVILKAGEGPDGPSPAGLKISTFKVASEAQAHGIADLLLSEVFARAIELQADLVFTTVLPGHEDVARYLELRGFRRGAHDLDRGERIYVADIAHPERIYSSLNRLAYDLLADEYLSRSELPGPNQESPEYLAGSLAKWLHGPHRLLELGPGSGSVLAELGKIANETVAVEVSPRMAEVARAHAPDALIVVGDILSLDFVDRSFDGIYAGAFLHLFPQTEAEQLVQRIARWVKQNGVVFINTSVSSQCGEAIELKADYIHRVARFRSRWTEEQFRRLIESNGLKIIDRITTDERERNKFWVAFICTPSPCSGV
jgi:SAM-dependent methyltransferase